MTHYIRVNNLDNVRFSERWRDSQVFQSYGKLINKKGEFVTVEYPGTKYQICLKKERYYTLMERVTRICKGLFFSILTLGLCNRNSEFRRLFTDDRKTLRFAVRVIEERPEHLLIEKVKEFQKKSIFDSTKEDFHE
jgi:hypothetical protein